MLVRDAEPDTDAATCAAIYGPYVAGTAVSFEVEPLDTDAMTARMQTVMSTHPWIVAAEDDRVVGYAYATVHRQRAAYRWTAETGVYVASDHQGRGVGRTLYQALLPLLAAHGMRRAVAGITLPNPASVALHVACGFSPVGVYRRIGWKAGAWHDVGWWQYDLEPAVTEPTAEPRSPMRLSR